MISSKTLADALTATRFFLAWVILWLGVTGGADALPTAMLVLVLAWVTDGLDGPLARHDPSGRQSWIGDRDLETDVAVSVAVLAYLTVAGYVTPRLAFGYVILCAALLRHFRSLHLAWAVQAPPYGWLLFVALRDAQGYGLVAVSYVALVLVGTWPRFPQTVLPQFLEAMRNLGRALPEDQATQAEEKVFVENGNGNDQEWRPL